MQDFFFAKIEKMVVHRIGNKLCGDRLLCSKTLLDVNPSIELLLKHYFLSPFKQDNYYTFVHDSDLSMNEVFTYASTIFNDPSTLYAQSLLLAQHLFDQSMHPKIKSGELYVVYLKDCMFENNATDAIGIFKSESKDTFLKVYPTGENFEVESDKGVNINKLDKGAVIFNIEKDSGYVVSVIDNVNKGIEAQYWVDDFLHVKPRRDGYYHTQNIMSLYSDFITQTVATGEKSKADKAKMMNKTIQFLKENDMFDMNRFMTEVVQDETLIKNFSDYRHSKMAEGLTEQQPELQDATFEINNVALKKETQRLKSGIKLDDNFLIKILSPDAQIVKGYDEQKGLHYYQLFYNEES